MATAVQNPTTVAVDKRWRNRQERWRAPGELFRPEEFGVEPMTGAAERDARAFVMQHHYSGSMPATRLCVGLYRKTGVASGRLVGVAVFSVPMQKAVVTRYSGFATNLGVELGRFVLLDECAFNAETWFLARAFRELRAEKPELRAVVSYADPIERRTLAGDLCKVAHQGQIYHAGSGHYAGRASPRMLLIDRDGQVVSGRALSKIRNGESGQDYAMRRLVAAGAPERAVGEDPQIWLRRVLALPIWRRCRHPGNLAFGFGLDPKATAQILFHCGTPIWVGPDLAQAHQVGRYLGLVPRPGRAMRLPIGDGEAVGAQVLENKNGPILHFRAAGDFQRAQDFAAARGRTIFDLSIITPVREAA